MDYITSNELSFPQSIPLLTVPMVALALGVFVTRKMSFKRSLIALCAVVAIFATCFTIIFTDMNVSRKAAEAATIESFQQYYGVTLDRRDLRALGYPGATDIASFKESPQEFTYYNTAPIQTGESRADFEQLTLAGEDGKIYLYRQVGATYEELEPIGGE